MKRRLLVLIIFITALGKSYAQELTLFDRPNTIIILSIPSSEAEFKNIFKRNPSKQELENITVLLNQYKGRKNVYELKEEEDLERMMKRLNENYNNKKYDISYPRIGFSVVGHNEKGDFFFPNGKSLNLDNIQKKIDGPAMFLSCNAQDYGVTGVNYKLTYSEALNIASDIDNIVTQIHNEKRCNIYFDTPRKIANTMMETLNQKSKVKYTAKFLGAAGGLTGGFVLIKQLDTSENAPQTDSTSIKQ